jgi:acetyl esterase/lipase
VVGKTMHRHRDIFANASTITRVHPDAPPFMVIHGDADHVIPVPEARVFVDAPAIGIPFCRSVSADPGAGHGFDLTDRWSTQTAVHAAGQFLDIVHRNHCTNAHKQAAAV